MSLKSKGKPQVKENLAEQFTNTATHFKGSVKRRVTQYIDNIVQILAVFIVFIFVDLGVDYLYKHQAETQSAAQYFTIQDLEGVILALMIVIQLYNVINLVIEIRYDSIHWFRERSVDSSWSSFQAFKALTPWHQWVVYLWLLSLGLLTFSFVLMGLT